MIAQNTNVKVIKMIMRPEDIKIKPLFPEHYVNYKSNHKDILPSKEALLFESVLDKSATERKVQRYIKSNKKWFIPYSILDGYPFYHHGGAYLFVEQQLGTKHRVDYCLLADDSDGYHLLLVELEMPNTQYLLQESNTESKAVRKGLTQIRDWRIWLDDNRAYFLKNIGLSDKGIDIPMSRIHYCLVVSRRKFMDERAKKIRSDTMAENTNLRIITYDRIVDNIANLEM